jgi:hypothetical protein
MEYRTLEHKGDTYFSLRLEDACEFLLTKDYTDNWRSEMHERFCFWSLEDWKKEIEAAGFSLHPSSRALTNPWIRKNRWEGKVNLYDRQGNPLDWPPTHMILLAQK